MSKQGGRLWLLVGLCVSAACTETAPGISDTRPSGFGAAASMSMAANPSVVTAQSVRNALCPTIPPFVGNINLGIESNLDFDITVEEIRMQFTDPFGITAPPITLPPPQLTAQFGSTLIRARGDRFFPLAVPFGCGTGRRGTIVIIVTAGSSKGQFTTNQVKVEVN